MTNTIGGDPIRRDRFTDDGYDENFSDEDSCDEEEYEDWSDYYDELDDLADDEYDYCAEEHEPYPSFKFWIEDWVTIWRQIMHQLWEPCPDDQCHVPYRILWFLVGKHKDCIPF